MNGFSFNGQHSSNLGIHLTASGPAEFLFLPTIMDEGIVLNNRSNGSIFLGSKYTERRIELNFSFVNLNDQKISEMQKLWNDKKIHELIFDDRYYKIYHAKLTGLSTIKYLAFSQGQERYYNGEGQLTFIIYNIYAMSQYEYRELFPNEQDPLIKFFPSNKEYGILNKINDTFFYQIDNVGDINIPFTICLPLPLPGDVNKEIRIFNESNQLVLQNLVSKKRYNEIPDRYILIDMAREIIEGLDSEKKKTGILYNEFISNGNFFELPQGISKLQINGVQPHEIKFKYYFL